MTPRGLAIQDAQYQRNIRDCFKAAWRFLAPRPAYNVWQWGEAYRRIATEATATPGPYRLYNAPYQREPQEAFLDPRVQVTVLQWGSRLGKTEIINNLDGYIMDLEPCGILVVYPTIEKCRAWSTMFFMPMVEATERIRSLIGDRKLKDSENTILAKKFPGGRITAVSANSPPALRQVQARLIQCDEIDAFSEGPEGDPVMLALKRADSYSNSIQVLASSPSIRGISRIEGWMARSDDRRWMVNCPRCNHRYWFQVLEHLDWDEGNPESAGVKCQGCNVRLTDDERITMTRAGAWEPLREFSGIRGYWLDALSSLFPAKKGFVHRCHQLAQEQIDARAGGDQGWQVFLNTVCNLTWEPGSQSIEARGVAERAEEYSKPPAGVQVLTCGVDVQGDRLELEIVGWGKDEESWSCAYVQCHGDTMRSEPWEELRRILMTTYERQDGVALKISRTLVDGGYITDEVFRRTSWLRAGMLDVWTALGARKLNRAMVETKMRGKGIRRYWQVGTNAAKQTIYSRLANQRPGSAGYCHFPRSYTEAFYEMLTSERGLPRVVDGSTCIVFEPRWRGIRNEALDCRVYALAALRTSGRRLDLQADQPLPLPQAQAKPAVRRPATAGNWALR